MLKKLKKITSRISNLLVVTLFAISPMLGLFPKTAFATAPTEINDCVELQKIGYDEDYPLNGDYVLGNDIDCADTANWNEGAGFAPIGTYYNSQESPTSFTGSFDGQNYTISNLFINRTGSNNIGLFGIIDDGSTVENFTLSNVDITGDWYVGAVAGGLVGHLENAHASGTVHGTTYAGGLVGQHVPVDNLDNSSPLVYTWNGQKYQYTDDVGDQLPKEIGGEDLAQIDKTALMPKGGKYSMKISEEYNEIVYYDDLSLMTYDHEPGYTVVSPLMRNTTVNDLRTIKDTPTHPLVGCTDMYGHDCLNDLKNYDDKWSYHDPSEVNSWILDFGDLSADKDTNVQLVMRAARDYSVTPASKLRTVQVQDADGNWVEIPGYNKTNIGSDGSPRLRTLDLTGKFISNHYKVKVGWDTLQANYFAVDTSPQVPVEEHTYQPEHVGLGFHGFTAIDRTHFEDHNYDDVSPQPASQFTNQFGNFTKYGDITPLLQNRDDQYAVMRYGDELDVSFPYNAPAAGKERSYILNNHVYYKHANLGTLGTHVDPLPYQGMTSYDQNTQYPNTPENQAYKDTWNTRQYVGNDNPPSSTIVDSSADVDVSADWCNAGGLVGRNYEKEIIGSHASGDVTADCDAGGLAGNDYNGNITRSSASGNITATDNSAGGLTGFSYTVTFDQDFFSGTVAASSYTGGISGAGYINTITNSYVSGDVMGDVDRTGGLIGDGTYMTAINSYVSGNVSSNSGEVGGLYGAFNIVYNDVGIKDSFVSGSVTGPGDKGALVGVFSGASGYPIDNSYWNLTSDDDVGLHCYGHEAIGIVTGDSNCTKKTNNAAYFKSSTAEPMANWNFETIWSQSADQNDGYPCLTEVTGSCSNDNDGDNIDNSVEQAAPNDGDANNDGTPDYQQANVTSFVNTLSDKYMVLQTSCTDNFNIQLGAESSTSKDAGYNYPDGLVGFVGRDCGEPGVNVAVNQYYFGNLDPAKLILRKWNTDTLTYTTISDATISQVTIGGQTAIKVSYVVKDGGILDQDATADGNIKDPVGIATSVISAPNTGFGGTN